MCDGFNHGALQIAVAQICQSMGWDSLQKSTHDLLTDVLQKYLEEIAKSAHGYCQLYCRTEPNLDDLNHAFQDVGVCLHELEDFVSQVDQVPFIHQLPRFPKPKPCALHHPCNGEVAERLEQYYDYLPPLVSKLLQNEDENKAAADAEEGESTNAGDEQRTVEGFVRNEIKTVGEETSNSQVAVKRPLDTPIVLENEAKKRRVDLPFLQKGNRGNEMDILDALQGNLSSPSPTPSPDIWSTAKTFEIPPTLPPVTSANSAEDAGPSKPIVKIAKKKEENPPVKPLVVESKSSPKKKAKTPKNTASPVSKSASLLTSPPTPSKEKPPSAVKSPLEKKKKPSTPETPAKMKGKTTPKKDKKVAVKPVKPDVKSPPPKKAPDCSKENVMAKEAMPKLIIKPIKKRMIKNHSCHFQISHLLVMCQSRKSRNKRNLKQKTLLARKKNPRNQKKRLFLFFKLKLVNQMCYHQPVKG
ncbi:PREDICTED: transcription initiation factor TFIID subunit 3-like [Acropora digitifera]|uniref:transcription initiation factor TFIID subunit 3-like n=1 Tax=Acropora digitifera TaxID=70779 RepID=UPI00077AACFB|nr:PREDICTED: transcription initiation factor TFIID subunit 3-like [Acropora digitifera]